MAYMLSEYFWTAFAHLGTMSENHCQCCQDYMDFHEFPRPAGSIVIVGPVCREQQNCSISAFCIHLIPFGQCPAASGSPWGKSKNYSFWASGASELQVRLEDTNNTREKGVQSFCKSYFPYRNILSKVFRARFFTKLSLRGLGIFSQHPENAKQ